jgi:CDP-glucose 4,6-dehydratase
VEELAMKSVLSSYTGKRVLITGHTGFKGSWLATWLRLHGAQVTGYALPPKTAEDNFCRLGLADRVTHIEGNLLDLVKLSESIEKAKPEIIFHLAAQPLVRLSYSEPKLTFDTNVGGGVNLLEAVRGTSSVRALVFVTSDKCYRNDEWVWGYRENDALGGRDPYSASKACAELVFRCYQETYFASRKGFAAASARAGNVIGGGDFAEDRIVPDCIRALRAADPIRVRNPEATRPWQHVLEPLSGYLALGARLLEAEGRRFSGAWNFGPSKDSNRTVGELVSEIVKVWGSGEMRVDRDPAAPHEAHFLHLNCDKACAELSWRPAWSFHEGVKATADWYRKVLREGRDAWEITASQIHDYESGTAGKL